MRRLGEPVAVHDEATELRIRMCHQIEPNRGRGSKAYEFLRAPWTVDNPADTVREVIEPLLKASNK